MRFEYDPNKSLSNKAKHGIDFEEAKNLWKDLDRLEAPILRPGEQRFIVIGSTLDASWTAIITYRGGAIRIISVRRAREEEIRHYEESKNNS